MGAPVRRRSPVSVQEIQEELHENGQGDRREGDRHHRVRPVVRSRRFLHIAEYRVYGGVMLAADSEGIFTGALKLSDILLLVAFLLFTIAFVVRLLMKPIAIDFTLIAAGLACTALALMVV